jgi:hypothetical protein
VQEVGQADIDQVAVAVGDGGGVVVVLLDAGQSVLRGNLADARRVFVCDAGDLH